MILGDFADEAVMLVVRRYVYTSDLGTHCLETSFFSVIMNPESHDTVYSVIVLQLEKGNSDYSRSILTNLVEKLV